MRKFYTSVLSCIVLMLAATFTSTAQEPANIPDGWEYWGKGKFTDDMVSSFLMLGPVTCEVDIIRKTDNANYIRILSPYGQAYADAFLATNQIPLKETEYNVAGDKYFELDITDPEKVTLPAYCYTGCSWGYGELYWGLVGTNTFYIENNTVKAPTNGMGIIDDTGFYYANQWGEFALVLPESDGVTEIIADDNAPIEYFDMQGRKVANPENGIYIRRQGTKTSKICIK